MKQSKIGMIGCGMISEVYAKNITERFGDLQLVACADLRMEAAQARAEQFGAKAMTVDELLADPDIDIVLNLTIPDQHAAVSMAALKAGKNVYSEKPLAIHMQDAKSWWSTPRPTTCCWAPRRIPLWVVVCRPAVNCWTQTRSARRSPHRRS